MKLHIALPSLAIVPLLLAACGSSQSDVASSPPPAASGADSGEPDCPESGDEWEVAKLYIEHNATDADTGVHGLIGGEAWRELCVFDPAGNRIWFADPQNQLGRLGVADFFFESREPEASEYSIDDLRSDFPEGAYRVAGHDYEGTPRVGEALFTHDIPAEPEITAPALVEDPEVAGEALVPAGDLVVRWEPVTETIDGRSVEISGYEVIVTDDEHEDPNGLSRPVFDVHVPPTLTALTVPGEFFEPGTIYELEVLALENSGNQTIGLGFFATE